MTCDEFEQAAFDALDDTISPDMTAAMEAHRVTCSRCREIAAQVQKLDATLRNSFTAQLPTNFDSRLHQRLCQEQLQAEYASGLVRLQRGWAHSSTLTESICCAVLAAMVCWLGGHLLSDWPRQIAAQAASFGIQLLTPTLAGALFLFGGLIAVFPLLRRHHTLQP